MEDSTRLDPDQNFPEDLTTVDRDELDILNSRNHRSRDRQYIENHEVDPETEGQHHDLREELDRRQAVRDLLGGNSAEERAGDSTLQA